jgi:hypothetical protein
MAWALSNNHSGASHDITDVVPVLQAIAGAFHVDETCTDRGMPIHSVQSLMGCCPTQTVTERSGTSLASPRCLRRQGERDTAGVHAEVMVLGRCG